MNRDTFEYACNVLDSQHSHIARASTRRDAIAQKAFYEGCKMMLEIILSEAYTNNSAGLYIDPYGIHRVRD